MIDARRYRLAGDMGTKAMMLARYTAQLETALLYENSTTVEIEGITRDLAALNAAWVAFNQEPVNDGA